MQFTNISQAIGHTPLIKIGERLYAKLESVNPSGSVKDRMAEFVLNAAEQRGELKPGGTIVEASSGNTGIAFSMLAAARGYHMIVVMPSNMSIERKQMIMAFGAEIVEVGAGDFAGAVAKRDALIKELGAFNPNQFANPDNRLCHAQTTGQEILQQVASLDEPNKTIAAWVAGTGTGGTLMGVYDALLQANAQLAAVAVEPTESAVMLGGAPGAHSIQGIGDGFIPPLVDMTKVTQAIDVSSADAIARMRRLTRELGLMVGISAGANVLAAEKYMAQHQPSGLVVTVLPDRQERYFSMLQ